MRRQKAGMGGLCQVSVSHRGVQLEKGWGTRRTTAGGSVAHRSQAQGPLEPG